jgi:DNA replication and repair protein RecF
LIAAAGLSGNAGAVIRSLRLMDFRCFENLSLELPAESLVFVGQNAQGKTSLLEAVCVLVRLHSPRTRRLGQLVRFEGEQFGVAGECWGAERRVTYAKGAFDMRAGGEECGSQGDYLAAGGLLVWMGNEDLDLVRGPGEGRRRYLDFLGSQLGLDYRRDLSRYRRALKARNLLLKDRHPDEGQIAAYTALLVQHGDAIQRQRALMVELLRDPVCEAQKGVSGRAESVELSYEPAGGFDLQAAFSQAFDQERRVRQTVVGPHRDDLRLGLNGLSAAQFGSEGQQRTLAIALKIAQGEVLTAETGAVPVYLIDDVFGELDPVRRNALMGALPESAQRLITTTSLNWLDEDHGGFKVMQVEDGRVTK